MKKTRTAYAGIWRAMLLCLWLSAFLASSAQAAPSKGKALFTLVVRDGYHEQQTTIYETKVSRNEQSAAGTIAAEKDFIVNPAGKKVKAAIINKTAYFRQHYTDAKVSAKAAIKAGKTKKLKVSVTNAYGKKASCKVKVTRPKQPEISAVTPGTKKMSIRKLFRVDFAVTSSVPVDARVQVFDKKGSSVYQLNLGHFDQQDPAIVWFWSGLKDDETFIKKGTYKGRLILTYSYGKTTKTVSRDFAFKAKKASAATTPETPASPETPGSSAGTNGSAYDPLLSDFTKSWGWTMMISGDDTVDYLCEYICQKVLSPKMSEVQRAKKLYEYCSTHYSTNRTQSPAAAVNLPNKIDVYSAAAKKKVAAYGKVLKKLKNSKKAVVKNDGRLTFNAGYTTVALSKETGDCTNFARMFQVLCRHAGLDAGFMHNSLAPGKDPLSHYWNIVKIDGKWYQCDGHVGFLRHNGFVYFARGTKFMVTYNPSEGMYHDDVRRYGNIDPSYKEIYATLSKTDCPGR